MKPIKQSEKEVEEYMEELEKSGKLSEWEKYELEQEEKFNL